MTTNRIYGKAVRFSVLIIALFLFITVIMDPGGASDCYFDTAANLYRKVIPILFPFMVISRLISEILDSRPIEMLAGRITRKIFKLPGAAALPFFLGAICSFPVGAFSAVRLYRKGELSRENAERACALCNNTGPAFPAAVVGTTLLGNKNCGWLIWVVQICSAVLTGLIFGIGKRAESVPADVKESRKSVAAIITDSVSSSALSCVAVAGSVVFFSLAANRLLTLLKVSDPLISSLLYSLFEFSEGCFKAAKVGGAAGAAVCAFAISFSGFSVILQSAVEMKSVGLSVNKMIVSKVFQGAISATAVFLLVSFTDLFTPGTVAVPSFLPAYETEIVPAICFFAVSAGSAAKILHLIYRRG